MNGNVNINAGQMDRRLRRIDVKATPASYEDALIERTGLAVDVQDVMADLSNPGLRRVKGADYEAWRHGAEVALALKRKRLVVLDGWIKAEESRRAEGVPYPLLEALYWRVGDYLSAQGEGPDDEALLDRLWDEMRAAYDAATEAEHERATARYGG